MAWLTKVLGRGESPKIEEIVEPPKPVMPSKPPLLLLVADASGMAALRLVAFEEAQAACDYIEFWYPNRSAGTLYAIWALPGEPDPNWSVEPDQRGEAVILVRDERKEDVVYSFSFADLPSAWAFLRKEMEKDLDLTRVMIYWAVPIDIDVDALGKVRVSPDAPPTTNGHAPTPVLTAAHDEPEPIAEIEYELPEVVVEAVETEPVVEVVKPEEPAHGQAEDQPHTMPAAEQPQTTFVYHDEPAEDNDPREAAEALFEDDGDDLPAEIGEEVDIEDQATDEVAATEGIEIEQPVAEEEPIVVEEVEPIEALPELVIEKTASSFHETEFVETPLEQKKPHGSERRKDGNGHHKDAPAEPVVDSEQIEVEELVVDPARSAGKTTDEDSEGASEDEDKAGVEHVEASTNGHKPSQSGHSQSNGHRQTAGKGLEDELTRVLNDRKLTQRDEPFQGFNSPRGRF